MQALNHSETKIESGPNKTSVYVDPQEKWSNEFDKLLLSTIDETIRYVMGESNALIIFQYIKENYCNIEDIPKSPKSFSSGLRDLIGPGRTQMHGAACILEETIAEELAMKMGKKFEVERPINFPEYILELKQMYIHENRLKH